MCLPLYYLPVHYITIPLYYVLIFNLLLFAIDPIILHKKADFKIDFQ